MPYTAFSNDYTLYLATSKLADRNENTYESGKTPDIITANENMIQEAVNFNIN
jgi:hypothetical protein